MSQIEKFRITIVNAPAGSGKTTALAQFAHQAEVPVAWYTVDSLDGEVTTFLAYLQRAIEQALGLVEGAPWIDVDDALGALDQVDGLLVVIDDLHLVSSKPAEHLLGHLAAWLPDGVTLAIGSRTMPGFDTARLEVAGELLLIDADDLRFRTWEAEQLLDQTYGLLLRPDDVARLTRRVGGWAAGFQLFRLAARDKSPSEQRRLAQHASTHSPLARRYLTQNVLGALTDSLRDFLLQTSILGVVTGEIADDLLGRTGSELDLAELEASDVFVTRLDDRTYRYHEVLRSHLEAELADAIDPEQLGERYLRAAELLETAGFYGEAVRCYVRSNRRESLDRLATLAGSGVSLPEAGLFDDLEENELTGGDPWLLLLRARTNITAGRFRQAQAQFRAAEAQFGADSHPAAMCRWERADLAAFTDPMSPASEGWLSLVHRGLTTDPIGAAHRLSRMGTAEAHVASGSLLFLVGRFDEAGRCFDEALLSDAPPDCAIHAGRLGRQLVRLVTEQSNEMAALAVVDRLLISLDHTWIGRLAGAMYVAIGDPIHHQVAARLATRCDDDGDPWGAIIAHLAAGIAADTSDTARGHFSAAADIAERQRSPLLLSAAQAGLAANGGGDALDASALQLAQRCGLQRPPLDAIMHRAGGKHGAGHTGRRSAPVPSTDTHITTRCFGDFAVAPRHDAIDALRPQARAVLMRLAADTGAAVHCDILIDDLWGGDRGSAHRGLQVAVSAIRKALADDGAERTVDRVDGGYALTTPAVGGDSDLALFRELASTILSSRRTDDAETVAACERALALSTGGLLPAAGSADWVVGLRDQVARQSARIAACGARAALQIDDVPGAIRLAELGLEIDRFDDELWRLMIAAHEQRGDTITVERLRQQYADMLRELGLSSQPVAGI